MPASDFLSDTKKQEIIEAADSCKGKIGLIALKIKCTIPQLECLLNSDLNLKKYIEDKQKTFEEAFEDIADVQLKLGIITGQPWALNQAFNGKISIRKYLKLTKQKIAAGQKQVLKLSPELEYFPSYDDIAYEVLSCSPFTTMAHLCKVFFCGKGSIKEWRAVHPSFNDGIDRGLSEGEVKARSLLLESAFEPQSNINTALLKILASNVYEIREDVEPSVVINNSTDENKLDIQKLDQKELDVFLKAYGHIENQSVIDMRNIESQGVIDE